VFVRRGVDNNFFFHTGTRSTSDSTPWKRAALQRTKMDVAPFDAADRRREKLSFATVQIGRSAASAAAAADRPAGLAYPEGHPCRPRGYDKALSTQARDWW